MDSTAAVPTKWLSVLWSLSTRWWPVLYIWLWAVAALGLKAPYPATFFPSYVWGIAFGSAVASAIALILMPKSMWMRSSMVLFGTVAMVTRIYASLQFRPRANDSITWLPHSANLGIYMPVVGWSCWIMALLVWSVFSAFLLERQGSILAGG